MNEDTRKSDPSSGQARPIVFRLGGRDFREGDSLSPEEAEEFGRRLIESTCGPVTIEDVNESTGTTVRRTVDEWAHFASGPSLSEEKFDSFRRDLVRKGYLAFGQENDGLKYHTAYRVLSPRYFDDFDRFTRCQDIPASYFAPVKAGNSWFVSHRWASPDNPDPVQTQFKLVREFVGRHQVDGIWYDYSCMPQEPHSHADHQLFVESLRHMNSLIVTTNFLSLEVDDYYSRAWCHYERMICELLCCCQRSRLARRGAPDLSDELIQQFVIDGRVPSLTAEKPSDLPVIRDLLITGGEMFKMLAVHTTFALLNSFGFQFGVGTAARLLAVIDFGKFWTIWQILAGSSGGSGIRLPHLLNVDRLRVILTQRHEQFGTHARFFAGLRDRMLQTLDMRIVEQVSASRLAVLLNEVSRSGPVPDAYTKLALIELVYWIAGRDQPLETKEMANTEKPRTPQPPRRLCGAEVLVLFAFDTTGPEIDDDWFEEVFQGLASDLAEQGVWFGGWKLMRVPDMTIEVSKAPNEPIRLPGVVLDELRVWDSKQSKPNSIRIVRIREFSDKKGFALVVHVPDGSL